MQWGLEEVESVTRMNEFDVILVSVYFALQLIEMNVAKKRIILFCILCNGEFQQHGIGYGEWHDIDQNDIAK